MCYITPGALSCVASMTKPGQLSDVCSTIHIENGQQLLLHVHFSNSFGLHISLDFACAPHTPKLTECKVKKEL